MSKKNKKKTKKQSVSLNTHRLPAKQGANPRDIFKPYVPEPGVVGEGYEAATANDSCGSNVSEGFYGNFNITNNPMVSLWEEGIGFPGYPYLSMLSLRREYRMIVETRAEEMTREGISFNFIKKDQDKDNDKLDQIEMEFKRHDIMNLVRKNIENDAYFGISHIGIHLKSAEGDEEELQSPLYLTNKKIKKGDLKGFKLIEPRWTTPVQYETNDPFDDYFYKPSMWWVMGKQIHSSRLITTITEPVPDLLKPAFNFGGVSLAYACKPYVDNWLRTRQSVSDLIHSFTIMVLKTDLWQNLATGCDEITKRAEVFAAYRDNRDLFIADHDKEELSNVSAPLSTLDKLQAQSQEHMASASGIPLVKLLGVTPSGLNASSDGEIRSFYDRIAAMQEKNLRPIIETILKLVQLDIFGEIDPNITFDFNPLWQLDEVQQADVNLKTVQTVDIMTQSGAVNSQEAKEIYKNMDLSCMDGVDLSAEAEQRQGAGDLFNPRNTDE